MDSEGEGAIAVSHAQLVTGGMQAVHPDAEEVPRSCETSGPARGDLPVIALPDRLPFNARANRSTL